jgi:arylsulfatase A-like enzyme
MTTVTTFAMTTVTTFALTFLSDISIVMAEFSMEPTREICGMKGTKENLSFKTLRTTLIIGLALGLSAGCADIACTLLCTPGGIPSLAHIIPPLAATAVAFFLIYMGLWLAVVFLLRGLLKPSPIPISLAIAVLLGLAFISASLNDLLHYPLSRAEFTRLLIILLISSLAAIATYLGSHNMMKSDRAAGASCFGLALPFIIAELIPLAIFHSHLAAYALYVLAALITLLMLLLVGTRIGGAALVIVFLAVLILVPLTLTQASRDRSHALRTGKQVDHTIKHVILIIVDTLRPDFLSCYGSQEVQTPAMDRLADDSILFEKAIAPAPWTLPSIASIMTGVSPFVHLTTTRYARLPNAFQTLAERMRDAGYVTAAIGFNPFLLPVNNASQGFLDYDFYPRKSIRFFGGRLLQIAFPNLYRSSATTTDLTKLSCAWIEAHCEENFFLWIHYYDPHLPYAPPLAFLPDDQPPPSLNTAFDDAIEARGGDFVPTLTEREWIKTLYSSEIRYVDANIGQLLDKLKDLDIYRESLIILTSDHGEEFWEHGGFEHGHSLYGEVLSVPLMIKLPQSIADGRVRERVTVESITPTILDLCQIDFDPEKLTASSLSPLLRGAVGTRKPEIIFSTGVLYFEEKESVIFEQMKYIYSQMSGREELYGMTSDPGEEVSLLYSHPEEAKKARELLEKHRRKAESLKTSMGIEEGEQIKLDGEMIQRLKSLGYVR